MLGAVQTGFCGGPQLTEVQQWYQYGSSATSGQLVVQWSPDAAKLAVASTEGLIIFNFDI